MRRSHKVYNQNPKRTIETRSRRSEGDKRSHTSIGTLSHTGLVMIDLSSLDHPHRKCSRARTHIRNKRCHLAPHRIPRVARCGYYHDRRPNATAEYSGNTVRCDHRERTDGKKWGGRIPRKEALCFEFLNPSCVVAGTAFTVENQDENPGGKLAFVWSSGSRW